MDYGILKGHIDIGPLCPVEKNPPDPKCLPTADTYKEWPVAIYTNDRTTKIRFAITPDENGNYSLELPAGRYILGLDRTDYLGNSNLPVAIDITKGNTTVQDIMIDTGIR